MFLELVELHSKDLKLADQEVRLADNNKKEALPGALPRGNAGASYVRNLSDQYMYVELGESTSRLRLNRDNEYGANITVRQTLISGAVYNAIRAAPQYKNLTENVYEDSQRGA